MTILDEIFTYKRIEVEQRKRQQPIAAVTKAACRAEPALDFIAALAGSQQLAEQANGGAARRRPALIAEVKRRSPSRGLLTQDFDPLRLASTYTHNGASAISVLTDERFFGGRLEDMRRIAGLRPRLPLLRKDFICDPYQIYEARSAGADAVLLIVAYLPKPLLHQLYDLALQLGMAPFLEVHQKSELQSALDCQPRLVGINNRDLRDFSVSLENTLELRPHIPPGVVVVSESGIHNRQDVDRLAACGVDAILVGEALVTAPDVPNAVRELASSQHPMEINEGFHQ